MEQVRSPSASTQRVDANGVSLDRIGARTTKLWPFEAAGALGTAAAAKAPRGRVVFQNKSVLEVS